MLYLLQDCYKDCCRNYHDVLKIGYCKEEFNSSRKLQYDTHNYGYEILCELPGDLSLENILHIKFNRLNCSYNNDLKLSRREWFDYSEDIVRLFSTAIDPFSNEKFSQEEFSRVFKDYILFLNNPINLYNCEIDNLLNILSKKRVEYQSLVWEEMHKDKSSKGAKNVIKFYRKTEKGSVDYVIVEAQKLFKKAL